jgi:hypothetical protein
MIKRRNGVVYGYVAWVEPDDLTVLDRYEGVGIGNYKRSRVKVTTQQGEELDAIAYISRRRERNPPSRAYKQAVARTIGQFWRSSDGSRITEEDIVVRNPRQGEQRMYPSVPKWSIEVFGYEPGEYSLYAADSDRELVAEALDTAITFSGPDEGFSRGPERIVISRGGPTAATWVDRRKWSG